MLTIQPQTVCFIIAKAREFQAKEEVVIPEDMPDSPSDNWARQILADHGDDHVLQEVAGMINELDDDAQAELVALMWLGRGDYMLDEWEVAVVDAARERSDHTPEYLLAHPQVSFYLEEGLALHGFSCD
ncbi:MAG TPA: DUF3775 domain-containing protein [Mariprofundaceae bacterium]|nr:DUF3775 domain-containing protein [Mariprofundaceae bacterium]